MPPKLNGLGKLIGSGLGGVLIGAAITIFTIGASYGELSTKVEANAEKIRGLSVPVIETKIEMINRRLERLENKVDKLLERR